MTLEEPRKFSSLPYWIILILILAVMLAPVVSVGLCRVIAKAYGCRVDEGSAHPCMIAGSDYGELLYTLGVMGWLMLVTLPVGVLGCFLWLVTFLLHRGVWRRKVSRQSS